MAGTVVVPAIVVGSFVVVDRLTAAPEAIADPWPWLAALLALVIGLPLVGRWAGIHDWGYVPFVVVASLLVPWWGAALALYLILLGPVSVATAAAFWVLVMAVALLGSLVLG